MRWKVEVLNFPTRRRTSKTEQYKHFSERSRKSALLIMKHSLDSDRAAGK